MGGLTKPKFHCQGFAFRRDRPVQCRSAFRRCHLSYRCCEAVEGPGRSAKGTGVRYSNCKAAALFKGALAGFTFVGESVAKICVLNDASRSTSGFWASDNNKSPAPLQISSNGVCLLHGMNADVCFFCSGFCLSVNIGECNCTGFSFEVKVHHLLSEDQNLPSPGWQILIFRRHRNQQIMLEQDESPGTSQELRVDSEGCEIVDCRKMVKDLGCFRAVFSNLYAAGEAPNFWSYPLLQMIAADFPALLQTNLGDKTRRCWRCALL